MAVDDLVHLREQLPELFSDTPPPPTWDEEYLFIPIEHPEGPAASGSPSESRPNEPWLIDDDFAEDLSRVGPLITHLPANPPDLVIPTTFAGAPQSGGWTSPMPPPDAFAFYLPFHYFYPSWWGVYIILENALALARCLATASGGRLAVADAFAAVRIFLYAHEAFHHIVEAFATRLEITHRTALYRAGFQRLFDRVRDSDDCAEEMLATAHAYRRVRERFAPGEPTKLAAALEVLRWFIAQCPPGYRRAPDAFRSPAFEDFRSAFAEANQAEALPMLPKKAGSLWHCFPHAFSGISRVTSRVNYVVRRDSPLANRHGLNLRYLRYRDLRDKLLKIARCEPIRQGKGSHEIWRSPSGHTFPVPRHPRDINDGLLSSIIKQAGLNMSVTQFRAA